jgi:hypothetical protein
MPGKYIMLLRRSIKRVVGKQHRYNNPSDLKDLTPEQIVRLDPDLVYTSIYEDADTKKQLSLQQQTQVSHSKLKMLIIHSTRSLSQLDWFLKMILQASKSQNLPIQRLALKSRTNKAHSITETLLLDQVLISHKVERFQL